MKQCWQQRPVDRPNLSTIIALLKQHCPADVSVPLFPPSAHGVFDSHRCFHQHVSTYSFLVIIVQIVSSTSAPVVKPAVAAGATPNHPVPNPPAVSAAAAPAAPAPLKVATVPSTVQCPHCKAMVAPVKFCGECARDLKGGLSCALSCNHSWVY